VHFFPDDPADAVARKALRINLSDLAAKGAAPLGLHTVAELTYDLWLQAINKTGDRSRFFRTAAIHHRLPPLPRLAAPADNLGIRSTAIMRSATPRMTANTPRRAASSGGWSSGC
jgi:hypothetical protein